MNKLLFLLIVFCVFVGSAFAQLEGNPEKFCRNGVFSSDSKNYNVGNIKAKKGERVYFYKEDGKCPKDKNCRTKSYLLKDDEVLTSRTYGNFVCAWFEPKKGTEIVGWLRKDKVQYTPYLGLKYEPWIGNWKYRDSSLNIKRIGKTDEYEVVGSAFWKGYGNNIHDGEISAKGTLTEENTILLKAEDCEVKLRLVIGYLIVSDNLNCGGVNVTFSGVYLKQR